MIKAVLFDVGGVLLRTDDRSIRLEWEKRLGLEPGQSDDLVFHSVMGIKAQLGEITYRQLWNWVGTHLKIEADLLSAFHDGFWAGDVLDTSLVELVRELRPRYRTGIISNYHEQLRGQLNDDYGIADAFDLIVCSAEEAVMKPNPEIYRRALNRLELEAEDAIFIDDTKPNVDAAEKLGMQSIHFVPGIDLRSRLIAAGVEVVSDG